jgi:2,3-dihydroxybenzoate decarboxylase
MFAGRLELDRPVFAWTADTGAHALRLIFGGVCTRFPRLTIIPGHIGETLPYLLWRLDSRCQRQVGQTLAGDERPSAIFRRNSITTSGVFDPAPLAPPSAIVDGNILFSVDYPYEDSNMTRLSGSAFAFEHRSIEGVQRMMWFWPPRSA